VTRIRLFGGCCACCGERVTAQAPAGLEQGSPFGHSIAATVVYLHYAHAIGMERLALLMDELFSLSISEGAICNILARAREPLLDATLKQYLYDLNRRLDRIMTAVPQGEPGRKLHKRMLANRAHLFVFMTNPAVPYTNNVSERHLRPSVIFRKVTNGFRCEWGAETIPLFAPSSAPRRPIVLRCLIRSDL
jgi:hypothetical protein